MVTYVGDGKSTYTAKLAPMDGLQVSVVPEQLVFSEKNDKQSYKLSIEGPRLIKELVVYGLPCIVLIIKGGATAIFFSTEMKLSRW
ncbi:hypothetical protein RJ640_003231 [Escallonia rubra]|nr:hypothetical protein RJ640_003231 [Escallonia rubra]